MEPIHLPTHLDDPKYFLLFTMEDFLITIACLAIGVMLHALGYMILAAFAVIYISGRFRGSLPDGRLQHILYWHGVPIGSGHSLINPLARRFIG